MKIKLLILSVILFSCHRYEKKILKVEVSCDKEAKWTWNGNYGGKCFNAETQTVYLKEGSTLDLTIQGCQYNEASVVIVKVKGHTLYAMTKAVHKINLAVERK
jgi:hypothetical protein